MITGRCNLSPIVRYMLEVHKKQIKHYHLKNSTLPVNFSGLLYRTQICRIGHKSSRFFATFVRMASSVSKDDSGQLKSNPTAKNRLAFEKSPYLLQHANNPVEWYPWGHEAFEKAKKEDKVIFLSVGYSTCHWCHVMEHESFENPEIARIMNRHFVNIKVDREERPDIDRIYMTFVQHISGHGGWPMSVFLTPDLKPITGGTYFPPEQKYGVPGFKDILIAVAEKWIQSKSELVHVGSNIVKALKLAADSDANPNENSVPSMECARKCAQQLMRRYDREYGGFSSSPKFPQPVNFNFLFHLYSCNPKGEMEKKCLEMCLHTLTMLAKGGIHDHVGQGFSRYSVDGRWHVPHFEKMLYDQAQLLRSYAEAFLASRDPFYAEIVDDIVTYITRDLRHKEGGFFSAEDADSYPDKKSTKKKEGAFYVWTYDELESLLDKPVSASSDVILMDVFCSHYCVSKQGNVQRAQDPHGELTGQNVLIVKKDIEDTAEHFKLSAQDVKSCLNDAQKILFDVREKRPRPHLDDKIITAWNGLMISGLARAGVAVENKEYINYAVDAAKFVERHLIDSRTQTLLRSCYRGDGDVISQTSVPVAGFHVDYAFMIKGLLDLYEACFDSHWLELAEKLQDLQDELFWDTNKGGYFTSTSDDPTVILRLKDDQDGAEPSSNSIACENLFRLAAYLDRDEFNEKGTCILKLFNETLEEMPIAVPQLVSALLDYHDSITQIHIVGKVGADDTDALLRTVQQRLIPGKILLVVDHEQQGSILLRKNEVVGKMKAQKGLATAYVCRHHTCSLPVNNPEDLAALLEDEPRK